MEQFSLIISWLYLLAFEEKYVPRGRPPKVEHVRDDFLKDLNSARDLVKAVLQFEGIHPNTRKATLHSKHVRKVVELAFMGVMSSWEEFLERCFVRYMAGASTTSYTPKLRVGCADNIDHSYQLLSGQGNYDPSKDYLKISDPHWVLMKARLYLDNGKPFDILQNSLDKIKYANKIRNRVAHSSTKCKADFKEVAIEFLGITNGKLSQGFSAGNLLLSEAKRHFGQSAKNREITFFEAYMEFFEDAAKQLVP